ncbi:MAG: hypothetical protein L3K16_08725 [Thermoplasmata archaeon]|nr:hypothetical protein [Thermoplasmata archaeon]
MGRTAGQILSLHLGSTNRTGQRDRFVVLGATGVCGVSGPVADPVP